MSGLVDLDVLALRCRGEQARDHIREAVACYKSNAFRACIVATWNAIVFDFLHKLQELDLTGDGNAHQKLTEYEAIREGGEGKLKEALEFEREVLQMAENDFEFISSLEKEDLARLQKDRHRCAHPSMQSPTDPYQPTAELARAHLRNAVEIMLEKEPVQGKAAFDRICAEVKSSYFPQDVEAAKEHFQCGPLNRARPVLVRNLLVAISKSHMNGKNQRAERRRQLAAIGAIIAMHRETAEQVLRNQIVAVINTVEDDRLWAVVEYCHYVPETWDAMTNAVQAKLRRYVHSTNGAHLWWALLHAAHTPALKSMALPRFTELPPCDFKKSIEYAPNPELIPAGMHYFGNAGNFRDAEVAGECLFLLASWLDVEHIRHILEAVPKNNQIWGAGGIPDILSRLFEETEALHTETHEDWQKLVAALDGTAHLDEPAKWYTELKTRMVAKSMLDPSAIVVSVDDAESAADEPKDMPF